VNTKRTGPLICASTLGLGLGGFMDGILLHQVLQWHQMISNRIPPDTLINAKINMFWDGMFHLGTWTLTFIGLILLWRLLGRKDVAFSTGIFVGGLIFGWGVFNVMDSVFNHYLFALHNVRGNVPNPEHWNLGFLLFGSAQTALGWGIVQRGRKRCCANEPAA
jgi:uncharacterized membrane protein